MNATLATRPSYFTLVKFGWVCTFKPVEGGKVNLTKCYSGSWVSTRLLPRDEARAEWRQLKQKGFEHLD
jgi:hypothetical protein